MQKLGFRNALPFWVSLFFVPLIAIAALYGGWALFLPPLYGLFFASSLDRLLGLNLENTDPETPEKELYWHKFITQIWFPIQFMIIFGTIAYLTHTTHLERWEKICVMLGVGLSSGYIGINYAHELMHQRNYFERWLGDLLMTSVLYGHFRSEHLLVHHLYVGTPRDPVTARYNESFYHFFFRVLPGSWLSSFKAEKNMLARRKFPVWHKSNPFWRYFILQSGFLLLAFLIGGAAGLGLFLIQAFIAILQLEVTNYVEHYGLTRLHLGEGKYEPVKPRHSWNAAHTATNWFLINLQRHSDHHYKPDRRFPLLQNYTTDDAPQLPFGYPLMAAIALNPFIWRKVMNNKVRKWRSMYYPEVTDWSDYSKMKTPLPR